jgi:hypothetical protein
MHSPLPRLRSRLASCLGCICLAAVLLTACARDAEPPAAANEPTAAAKEESLPVLNARWSALAVKVPESLGALHGRLDPAATAGRGGPKTAHDLETARADLRHAESQWSKAQAAFATGNLKEAVTTASAAGAILDTLSGDLTQSAR